jgi:hypothetical protein
LLEVCRRGEITGGTVGDITATLVRYEGPADAVLGALSGEFTIGVESDDYPVQHFMGAQISPGPCRVIVENTSFSDFEEVKRKYEALGIGESMPVRFSSSDSVRQIFLRFYKGEPLAPLVRI